MYSLILPAYEDRPGIVPPTTTVYAAPSEYFACDDFSFALAPISIEQSSNAKLNELGECRVPKRVKFPDDPVVAVLLIDNVAEKDRAELFYCKDDYKRFRRERRIALGREEWFAHQVAE
uniref:Uncharacterized protein n=1 Tax=Odontella aurita TaxID=265563 RepID=A0A7S4KCG6_9STRA|mmetsp:Transcript_9338/g.28138  ORF Transcript_9338/g.28138 Transcript_9338/m.28138 type:complete len:119 (+) Transcript_9338:542-898(+)|eukprot:CAMPEP_0113526430 /NCGR_PEP_ID=MMETSP0015_2-20120614/736_1 /TAXON_ID=2838 /ORGANISM="Odontella" /LENGTH=118 /DNA_ID=CAMNT_0000424753 /DNA_START=408 /DNA_END=764 /DNA_ORIENTATION=+ /assembly_acc=CAM_ASM_000160